jgi:carbamoyltransferase
MYILGISDSHCATATLLKNGTIIACASEERFTRVKTQAGIPVQSIRYCLTAAGIDGSDLDSVAFAGEFNSFVDLSSNPNTEKNTHSYHRDTSLATKLYHFGRHYFYVYFERGLENKFPQLRNINKYIYKVSANILTPHLKRARTDFVSNLLDISPEKIIFVEHHLCHAYAALFASPFPRQGQKALVFTSDGQGDGLSSTLSVFRNGTLSRISKSSSTESLGALYAEITMFLGMKLGEDEYKVMGLAPYGKPRDSARAYEILKKLV